MRICVVLDRTVVDGDCLFDKMCGSHFQSQSEPGAGRLFHVS